MLKSVYTHESNEIERRIVEREFFNFTRLFVDRARQLARSGQKDHARDWSNYFQNARVLKVLAAGSAIESSSLEELRLEMQKLNGECHPLDVPDWTTDIAFIRDSLDKIQTLLTRKRTRRAVSPIMPAGRAVAPRVTSYGSLTSKPKGSRK